MMLRSAVLTSMNSSPALRVHREKLAFLRRRILRQRRGQRFPWLDERGHLHQDEVGRIVTTPKLGMNNADARQE